MLSTFAELAGFACAVVVGFMFGAKAGFGAAAVSLLIIGYSLEGARIDLRAAKRRQQDKWRNRRAVWQAARARRAAQVVERRRVNPKEQ